METILLINQLSKRYGRIQAVNQLSLEVAKGQVFGILGPNGSGKTTTLSMVLDLVRPDNGTFEWFEETPTKESRKRIGAVIETPNFFPYLSARKNLEIVAKVKGYDYNDIDHTLEVAGLFDRRHDKFKTYSFGMKQRLAIASALLNQPEVMILDEPTNGLDPQGIAQVRELILQVAKEGITIILASHLLDEVQKICDHVAVLNKGNCLFAGEVHEVLAISDCIELAAEDNQTLKEAIESHPGFKSLTETDGIIMAVFSDNIPPGKVNDYLQQKGITLTHLSERKRTLEQHFLELLKDNPS
ncbi:MAG: ATP-binding cassette domain-containing protein [Bacteroidales bacterium]|nr:ATP-binding cassette domain-containing protein [Bacteroidota bacterium]MBL6949417.1 ATP-binding cassette domain-containing protein [Bacteroidales bacterium]